MIVFVVFAGQWVAASPRWAQVFTFTGPALAIAIIVTDLPLRRMPIWLLLAPRDYLSAFIKVGAIVALAGGILCGPPDNSNARAFALRGWQWPRIRRQNFPVLLHHHRLRRRQRLSRSDFLRHHAEDDLA